MVSDEDIRRVREATDLVDLVSELVVLKQRGREFWGRCPFHEEKTPSFKVDPRSQLYHCFGCHAGGDVYEFVKRTQNIEFLDAVRYLADRANIEISEVQLSASQGKRTRLLELMSLSAKFFAQQLLRSGSSDARAARAYLGGRNMGLDLAKRWQLGYAPGGSSLYEHLKAQGYTAEECLDANVVIKSKQGKLLDRFYNRVMFPVCDLQGRVIAFGGRITRSGEPKYLNTSETLLFHKRETLYALDRAKTGISKQNTAIVVEGYTDTIAMHEAGFTNTVAVLGTALTMQHLKLLNRTANKVIYLFDGDEAGKRAATKAAELINWDITPEAGTFRLSLDVAELPPGMDPADLLASEGTKALQAVLDKASPLLKFAIQQSLRNANLLTPEGRNTALRAALSVLLPIRGSILANEYIANELVPQVGTDYTAAMALFNSMPAPYSSEGRAAGRVSSAAGTPSSSGAPGTNPANNPSGAFEQGRASSSSLQNDLIILFIEYPEVRELLAKAFERITWDSEEVTALVRGLLKTSREAESDELYALALEQAPQYATTLSAGLQQDFTGEAADYAMLLMYMLRELQLQDGIALAKIAYVKAQNRDEGDAKFKEIAQMQSELATIRERLAQIPKTLL